ncbi:MAG: Uma2 family endonuclease [Chloroflexi bacterium]|nr:Uma2 family endonuclease [Chloroflexota bacterium]
MLQRQVTVYTLEEYLALEETADHKSEYYNGEIFAMAGGSYNHNVIIGNINAALNQFAESKPCVAFTSDMRLLVKANGLYTYPDAMVICGQIEFAEGRNDTVTNPIIIVEVLSKSTRDYDRGFKFESYRMIETLQDYLLVDQMRIHVEYFHKLEDGRWVLIETNLPEATLTLQAINFTIPINRIYHKVDWSQD